MFATLTMTMLYILAILVSKALALGSSSSTKVLFKNVRSLTLRKDKNTSHRRVSAIPQLRCISGAGCRHYQVEVMRCDNAGSDYDDDSIQWTCKATIPEEFKLGSTDVLCEGYKNSQDPFILKGSCGVEYRLLLTEKGMEKYGHNKTFNFGNNGSPSSLFAWIFWLAFASVVFLMARSAWRNMRQGDSRRGRPPTGATWPSGPPFDGGDGGGGGPWFGGDNDDPPPPYTPVAKPSSSSAQQPWRPGFWAGAATGAAATYLSSRGSRSRNDYSHVQAHSGGNNRRNTRSWSNNGEGSSSSSSSTNWHSSTGFGGTSNR